MALLGPTWYMNHVLGHRHEATLDFTRILPLSRVSSRAAGGISTAVNV